MSQQVLFKIVNYSSVFRTEVKIKNPANPNTHYWYANVGVTGYIFVTLVKRMILPEKSDLI